MVNLGDCLQCHGALGVTRVWGREDGLPDYVGRVAVTCTACGRPHPDHPYQKTLDAADAAEEARRHADDGKRPAPAASAGMPASEYEDAVRQVRAVQAEFAALKADLLQRMAHVEKFARPPRGRLAATPEEE